MDRNELYNCVSNTLFSAFLVGGYKTTTFSEWDETNNVTDRVIGYCNEATLRILDAYIKRLPEHTELLTELKAQIELLK